MRQSGVRGCNQPNPAMTPGGPLRENGHSRLNHYELVAASTPSATSSLSITADGGRVRFPANAPRSFALAAAIALTIPFHARAATLYFPGPAGDPNLEATVSKAHDGDTIVVAAGQYTLTNQVVITNAITLRSSMGAKQTIFNVTIPDFGFWASNSAAVLDGFTVQADYGTYGLFCVGATVQNCIISNRVGRAGSAIFMMGGILSNSVVAYSRFAFPNNCSPACSAVYCSDGGLITGCSILGGTFATGDAIGVYLTGGQMRGTVISGLAGVYEMSSGQALYAVVSTIADCTISNNANPGAGGGAYLESCSMDRCIVTGNSARGGWAGVGGGGIFATNSVIRDSLIVNNKAESNTPDPAVGGLGGGVYMQGGALVNCTVARNAAFSCTNPPPGISPIGHGAGVYIESGGITNCIISSNYFTCNATAATDYEWSNTGRGVLDHCCTFPDPGGQGNIPQDPCFLDPANGNFHLTTNSPCVRAGIVQDWMSGATDLDGNPRTSYGEVAMGAYQPQFQSPGPAPSLRIFATRTNTVVIAWPAAATGYVLEQCPPPGASGWTAAEVSLAVVNGENHVSVSPTAGSMCYRLRHP